MFTMPHMQSQVFSAFVEQFFDREKDDTMRWLRDEMDSLVTTMFTQLKTKFVNCLESGDRDSSGQSVSSIDSQNFFQSHTFPQLTSGAKQASLNIPLLLADFNQFGQPSLRDNSLDISTATYSGSQVKAEIEESVQVHANSSANSSMAPSLFAPINSEQFNNLSNSENQEFYCEDEEDCDCEECVNGIDIKEEDAFDDDDSDSVELIEHVENIDYRGDDDPGEGTSRPAKRQRTDQANEQFDNNNREQLITIGLQCPQAKCTKMFTTKDQLDVHMKVKHSIRKFQCFYKDCNQSFSCSQLLNDHSVKCHPNTSQWPCGHCTRHLSSKESLRKHNYVYHQLGQFQCSFPGCQFTSEIRSKMYLHNRSHRQRLVCSIVGCEQHFGDAYSLKEHQRSHLGIHPFRCKLAQCDYSSASRNNAMQHIGAHLARLNKCQTSGERLSNEPKDYLEVIQDLL